MKLILEPPGAALGELVLEQGDWAGRSFGFVITACRNPVCECMFVTLNCAPAQAPPATAEVISLGMDLQARTVGLKSSAPSPAATALASALAREISKDQWERLDQEYFAVKAEETERADLDQLVPMFQAEPQVRAGTMVGYYEFLPYARRFEVKVRERTWLVDDQYCLRPDCSCRATILNFFYLPEVPPASGAIESKPVAIRYDYGTGRVELLDRPQREDPSPPQFLDGLKKIQPDLDSFLAKRHAVLKGMYQRSLRKEPSQPPPAARKVGRNQPCPCGSGKKYKHCCGRV